MLLSQHDETLKFLACRWFFFFRQWSFTLPKDVMKSAWLTDLWLVLGSPKKSMLYPGLKPNGHRSQKLEDDDSNLLVTLPKQQVDNIKCALRNGSATNACLSWRAHKRLHCRAWPEQQGKSAVALGELILISSQYHHHHLTHGVAEELRGKSSCKSHPFSRHQKRVKAPVVHLINTAQHTKPSIMDWEEEKETVLFSNLNIFASVKFTGTGELLNDVLCGSQFEKNLLVQTSQRSFSLCKSILLNTHFFEHPWDLRL